VKIEEYIETLPKSIISGEDVHLHEHALMEILNFADITSKDVFYHLGCGDAKGIILALKEFGVKKAVGIDMNENKIIEAKKTLKDKKFENCYLRCEDILNSDISDATVILFWFSDSEIIDAMTKKFSLLKNGCKIITLWDSLPGYLPNKVDFPYILNISPFKKAKDLKEHVLSIFGTNCIDFVTAWEFAERYTKAIGTKNPENTRFLTIMQSVIIWINAKNLGITCTKDIPAPIQNYISILRTHFGIEVEHLLKY